MPPGHSGRAISGLLTLFGSAEACLLVLFPSFAANCVNARKHPCEASPHPGVPARQDVFKIGLWEARGQNFPRFFIEVSNKFIARFLESGAFEEHVFFSIHDFGGGVLCGAVATISFSFLGEGRSAEPIRVYARQREFAAKE